MSVYQIAGQALNLETDGSSGNIDLVNTLNPITGGLGLSTVRIINYGTTLASLAWTPHDVTYAYTDVAYTTDSAEGVGATIDVKSTYFGYNVALANGGVDFLPNDVITVLGTAFNTGETPTNDLVITVLTVSTGGVIATYSVAGTPAWPEFTVSSILLSPGVETFIQVTAVPANGSYFIVGNNDGYVRIQPVTIVR
jgi:hypothetical protein